MSGIKDLNKRRAARRARPDTVARIDALTRNARNTWFVLLGVLVFVSVTRMNVQHIDFWGVNRVTQLPLVGVTVPTRLFFYAAPVLTAAVYCYFHLYLIRLWDVLAAAPARTKQGPLGEAVSPWLVTDAALHWRASERQDGSANPRMMETPAAIINLLLVWIFGIGVIVAIWLTSMAARDLYLTGASLICGFTAFATGLASLSHLIHQLAGPGRPRGQLLDRTAFTGLMIFAAMLTVPQTVQKTTGQTRHLAPLSLVGEAVVERPVGWLPYDYAKREFRARWCAQEGVQDCSALDEDREEAFDQEWTDRRKAERATLLKPNVNPVTVVKAVEAVDDTGASDFSSRLPSAERASRALGALRAFQNRAPNLRGADLREAFLPGLDLTGSNLSAARLDRINLEGAVLYGAALLDKTVLTEAQLQNADLRWAQMDGAFLIQAQMDRANLSWAQMDGANLSEAQMDGADLTGARMDGAILRRAQMDGAYLIQAQMDRANLSWAQMVGAHFDLSQLTGGADKLTRIESANLSASINNGGALRFADLTDTEFAFADFSNAFFDASVILPDGFAAAMGDLCQLQGVLDRGEPLPEEEFYARWRGWLEHESTTLRFFDWENFGDLIPEPYRDVKSIPPDDPQCRWKDKPLMVTHQAP